MITDPRLKRKYIELGYLKTWQRRRRAPHAENVRLLKAALRFGLRMTGLYKRGERNALSPVVRHMRLAFATLPEAFCGFTILHLSDLHADGHPELAATLHARLRELPVDLCVLTGDYRFAVSGPCHGVYAQIERILAGVQAGYGTVGILGNHDLSEMVPELERLGVHMLVNEALALRRGTDSIWIVGLDDPHYYGCDDLPGALLDVPEEAFKILLVHTPEMVDEAAESGVHLYLCGHTHGGQICLPLVGPLLTHASCPRRFARGVWRHRSVQGYTSAGVGCSGVTARFFCPPEIGLIELRCPRHCT